METTLRKCWWKSAFSGFCTNWQHFIAKNEAKRSVFEGSFPNAGLHKSTVLAAYKTGENTFTAIIEPFKCIVI